MLMGDNPDVLRVVYEAIQAPGNFDAYSTDTFIKCYLDVSG